MEKREKCIASLMPCFWKYSEMLAARVSNAAVIRPTAVFVPYGWTANRCCPVLFRQPLEGIQDEAEAFGKYLVGEGAEQCGFCSPGLIMNVVAMKKELDHPTDDEIRHYLEGNLCRCTGYMGQMRAIRQYVDEEVEA